MKKLKAILTISVIALTVALFTAILTVNSSAALIDEPISDNLSYTLDTITGELNISGNGCMENYQASDRNSAPWLEYRSTIKTVNINSGITSVGNYAFTNCTALEQVNIAGTVKEIGAYAFNGCDSLTEVLFDQPEMTAIYTAADFEKISKYGNYYLANDIDLGGKIYKDYVISEFNGILDGRGHSVFNYSIENGNSGFNEMGTIAHSYDSYRALSIRNIQFGKPNQPISLTADNVYGYNIGLVLGNGFSSDTSVSSWATTSEFLNVKVYGKINVSYYGNEQTVSNIAGFVGLSGNSKFEHCQADLNMTATCMNKLNVSGMIAKIDYNAKVLINDCIVNGTLKGGIPAGDNSVYQNTAGFVTGNNCSTGGMLTITNSVNNAEITQYFTHKEARAAGFVTYAQATYMENCTNNGSVNVFDKYNGLLADAQAGGIIAHANSTDITLKNCKNTAVISASNYYGGIVGKISYQIIVYDDCTTTDGSDRFGTTGMTRNTENITVNGAIPISNAYEFLNIRGTNNYYLTNDIDMGGNTYYDYLIYNFGGTIDGRGYSVWNYRLINTGNNDVGMIMLDSIVGSTLRIFNITFGKQTNPIKITVSGINGKSVGGILAAESTKADNIVSFSNVNMYIDIDVSDTNGANNIGGLIGYCRTAEFNNCSVDATIIFTCNSYSTSINMGGYIGKIEKTYSVKFENCQAKGRVNAVMDTPSESWMNTAGFVGGGNNGTATLYFKNCTNNANCKIGNSFGESRAAGFVAYSTYTMFENCVNNGTCEALTYSGTDVGGFVGCGVNRNLFINCINNGNISSNCFAAEFMGFVKDNNGSVVIQTFINCLKNGSISGYTSNNGFCFPDYSFNANISDVVGGGLNISENAFRGCSSLTTVRLPDTLESIGENAFSGCGRISTVAYLGTSEAWDSCVIASGNATLNNANRKYAYEIIWTTDSGSTIIKTMGGSLIQPYNGNTDKAETVAATYEFAGWDKQVTYANDNVHFTAVYNATPKKYTVKWIVEGKETSAEVEYGTIPTFSGKTEKAADAKYTYTFKKWNREVLAVTGNVTYTAVFDKTLNKYAVKWIVEGKETSVDVEYGTVPSFSGEAKKDADVQYTYTFKKWDKDVVAVTGEATYTAEFEGTLNKYAVKWIVEGKETSVDVEYGTVPGFSGEAKKEADVQYTYTFKKWNKDVVAVTGEATYTAEFERTLNKYEVKWIVDTKETAVKVEYGTVPDFDGEKTKASDVQFNYTFKDWDKEVAAVTGDVTYTAVFDSALNKYKIKWVVDGKETLTDFEYGTTPTFTGKTEKTADAENTYTFKEWDKAVVAVEGDATYTAVYTSEKNIYTVTWIVNGVISTSQVKYGELPSFTGSTDKPDDKEGTYTFTGWDKDISVVKDDVTYTAQYSLSKAGCAGTSFGATLVQLIAVICGGVMFVAVGKKH